ncbi:DUF6525 family protein [Polynucleobacter sp. JS-JIR-II-50]|uniref:DUF6525 family protein n=1 Tax=Polynucleobacter sp. JS-JIR-II-50 TaxID=2576919 RepID=UPI00352FF531
MRQAVVNAAILLCKHRRYQAQGWFEYQCLPIPLVAVSSERVHSWHPRSCLRLWHGLVLAKCQE